MRQDCASMTDILDRLMSLWTAPLPSGDEALDRFRALYTDPVRVNDHETPLTQLVERARMLQGALDDIHHRILQRVDGPGRVAVAFIISGRHVGPLTTPAGAVAPTGRDIEILTIDVLELEGDVVDTVWVVSDQLGILLQTGALEAPFAAKVSSPEASS